jgi:Transcriptional regulators
VKEKMADLSTVIFEDLKREIIDLTVKPGDKVAEGDICARYGVTRPVVRSAFQRLADVGLLEVKPYKGAIATLLDADYVYQMIYNRTVLEAQIISDFIDSKPSVFDIEELEHNIRKQKLFISQNDVDEQMFFDLDSALHQFWFSRMHCEKLWTRIQSDIVYRRFRILDFVGTLKYNEIVGDHEKLVQAIKNSDKENILGILGTHLNNGLRRMGHLIATDYKKYFLVSDNCAYWMEYNKRFNR